MIESNIVEYYLIKTVMGVSVLLALIVADIYKRRGDNSNKWTFYIIAAVVMAAGSLAVNSSWFSILISIASIELFLWVLRDSRFYRYISDKIA
jgi:branched-subunit amino acid transport protein